VTKALILSLFAIASGAYPSTISTFSISTVATSSSGVETDPCSLSGSGAGTASCSSVGGGSSFDHANASVTLTDNSIQISLSSHMDASTEGFASITHDDFYTAPVNGPVSAVLSLTCNNFLGASGAFTTVGHFSLGSTSVSPPVESIYTGASQGSGPCGVQDRLPGPPGFTGAFNVSLSAVNNIVHLHTYIDAGDVGTLTDDSGSIFVQNSRRFSGRKRKPHHRNTPAGTGHPWDVRVGVAGGREDERETKRGLGRQRVFSHFRTAESNPGIAFRNPPARFPCKGCPSLTRV